MTAAFLCGGLFAQSANSQAPATLKVMTYNIHHANPPSKARDSTIDLRAVAAVINTAKPDLVALQEIDVHNARAGVNLDEAAELGRLTGMHYYFTRAIFYRGGEYGDAVLSRFPIKDTMRYELPVLPRTKGETRSFCVIRIALPGKKNILFASTHLDQFRDEGNRLLQARIINDIVKTFRLPFIIGADFNARPDSRTIALLDSTLTGSCTSGCPLTIPTENPRATIDYIMYTPAGAFEPVGEVKTIRELYASDHLPVTVELKVRTNRP